jgi:hypothetical protein
MISPRTLLVSLASVALSLGLAADLGAQCLKTADASGVQCETLFAGQTINAGSVCSQIVGSNLVVTYSTTGCWQLVETHLWVGSSLGDMPTTRKGNPVPGQFPYKSGDISGTTSYSTSIPLTNLGFSCPSDDTTFYVAAHAALQCVDGNGDVVQTETGWGDGSPIVDKGNWATYFETLFTCDCAEGPGEPGDCETAFAKATDGSATCFLDIDEDGDGTDDFNRWGWTNSTLGDGTFTYEIWAAAGQCDTTKGTLVGFLTVSRAPGAVGTDVTVTYNMLPGFTMDEVHVYVGCELLARDKGEFTVAPGQFPIVKDLTSATTDTSIITGLECTPIFVVAHAVVCGF